MSSSSLVEDVHSNDKEVLNNVSRWSSFNCSPFSLLRLCHSQVQRTSKKKNESFMDFRHFDLGFNRYVQPCGAHQQNVSSRDQQGSTDIPRSASIVCNWYPSQMRCQRVVKTQGCARLCEQDQGLEIVCPADEDTSYMRSPYPALSAPDLSITGFFLRRSALCG